MIVDGFRQRRRNEEEAYRDVRDRRATHGSGESRHEGWSAQVSGGVKAGAPRLPRLGAQQKDGTRDVGLQDSSAQMELAHIGCGRLRRRRSSAKRHTTRVDSGLEA